MSELKVIKISKIASCRTFHDWTWPSSLPDFQDYNLVYGWNGTGKTTISDILRAVERKHTSMLGEFTVQTDKHGALKSTDLEGTWKATIPPIRVFNRDYVQDNIFSVDKDAITPIFYIGEKSVEKQKLVESKSIKLTEERENYRLKAEAKRKKEKELDDLSIRGGKAVKDALLSSGSNPYNTYNKGDFKNSIGNMIESKLEAAHFARDDEAKAVLKARFTGTLKEAITPKSSPLPDLAALQTSVKTILERSVVSENLTQLTDNEELSDWIEEGLEIHKNANHTDCQFCLQKLPVKRLADLEGHFNDQYSQMMTDIAAAGAKIDSHISVLEAFTYHDKATICEHLVTDYSAAVVATQAAISEYTAFLKQQKAALDEKKGKPFGKIVSEATLPADGKPTYKSLTDILELHNTDCARHATNVFEARSEYADAILSEYLDEYTALKAAAAADDTKAKEIDGEIKQLATDIKTLELEIKEHHKAAEDINEDLLSYLGHEEIKFQSMENGYAIYRFGEPAIDLSEGEKTAIALLYFLRTLDDKDFKPKGIVVIDDPVSSMDDGALFHAFGFIKEKTKDAHQLFILTHNFMFFRQVRNWFQYVDGRKKLPQKASFYQTKCGLVDNKRQSEIIPLDSLLREYESEYHYLFDQICKASKNTGTDLGAFYPMPNIARRVLESFLAFRNPSVTGPNRLQVMLDATKFSPALKTKILRFVHTHSHEDNIGAPEHDPSLLAETPAIMRSLLELIGEVDEGHHDEMMKALGYVVSPPTPATAPAAGPLAA